MLQQTQVATVIPYFERFIATYPTVQNLAAASMDEVLHLWSGLGYYSRARNLYRTAVILVTDFGGEFPRALEDLLTLPGIGRSTAGAILSLAYELPFSILDGNVKRVLARHYGVQGWPGTASVLKRLWALSDRLVPQNDAREYTQAVMDLGATVCTRRKPQCKACPLHRKCEAYRSDQVSTIPAARPRRAIAERDVVFLMIQNKAGAILLQRRPPKGVWGGLWSCPEIAEESELVAALTSLGFRNFGIQQRMSSLTRSFTHIRLNIHPLLIHVQAKTNYVHHRTDLCWYSGEDSIKIGVSALVPLLLKTLRSGSY